MAVLKKTMKIETKITLVTDEEWSQWAVEPAWAPPRPSIQTGAFDNPSFDYFKVDEDAVTSLKTSEDLLFVEFAWPSDKPILQPFRVPFHLVDRILVLSSEREAICKDRYAGNGIEVQLAPSQAIAKWQEWRRQGENNIAWSWMIRQLGMSKMDEKDARTTIRALFSLFELDCPGEEEMSRSFVNGRPFLGWKSALLPSLRDYSRHSPNMPQGLLGGIADLGTIVKEITPDGNQSPLLQSFREAYPICKDSEKETEGSFAQIVSVWPPENSFPKDLFNLGLAVFLHWKYLCEKMNGDIPYQDIEKDIASLKDTGNRDAAIKALWLLGLFASFKTVSGQFHAQMRRRRRDEKTLLKKSMKEAPKKTPVKKKPKVSKRPKVAEPDKNV